MNSQLAKFLPGEEKRKFLAGTFGLAILISLLHYITYEQPTPIWAFIHKELTKLYFLPALLAAFWGGRRSALLLSAAVSVLYLPHAIRSWGFTQSVLLENFSEILVLWIVGIVAGTLSDQLKNSEKEKTRLATLQQVSKMLGAVNHELMTDYQACSGLTMALQRSVAKSKGDSFSARLLLDKLEHLGSHLQHLQHLAVPQPLTKRKYNLAHLLKKSLLSAALAQKEMEVKFLMPDKPPSLNLDVKRMEFAFRNILQTLVNGNKGKKHLDISIKNKSGNVDISFNLTPLDNNKPDETWNYLQLLADPQKGYAFSLALAVIRSHGGEMDFIQKKEDRREICLTLPKN